ncbi:MAG TPA: hypothetical protein VK618_08515 [Flavitalea sp.]|nr:hypothetical protein [Flavitalea sp.]
MKKTILALIIMAVGINGRAQSKIVVEKSLSIRNAFESASEIPAPAQAAFTIPDSGRASYQINLGVAWNWNYSRIGLDDRVKIHSFSPFAVLNRNTMIDDEQHNYKLGFDHEFSFGTENDQRNSVNFLHSSLQFMNDRTTRSRSFIATSYFSLLRDELQDPAGRLFVNAYKQIRQLPSVYYRVSPEAGLEWQATNGSGDQYDGTQARIYASLRAALCWRAPTAVMRKSNRRDPNQWPKRLELALSYTGRLNFINTVDGDDYLPLFTPSLTYYPLLTDALSLAVYYQNGEDPLAGLPKQKYWQLSLQFQL